MTNRLIGMDPDEVKRVAQNMEGLRVTLEMASSDVDRAALVSLNPLSYGLQPGSLIIAPLSILGTQRAAAEVRSALGALDDMIARLHREADQQSVASRAEAGIKNPTLSPEGPTPTPPVGESPEVINQWWNSLTKEQQAEVIAHRPESIAGLDGVPARVRDKVNRRLLDEMINDPSRSQGDRDIAREIQDDLHEAERLEPGTYQLLLVDLSNPDNPKVAVSVGDADTADVIAPVVYGIKTDGSDIDSSLGAARALQHETTRQLDASESGKTSATVMWLGYDSGNEFTVSQETKAIDGAPAFISFVEGLRAANHGVKVVPVAHSYGTRLVSEALSTGGDADGLVMLGSPGVRDSVHHVSDMNVPSDYVHSGRSGSDIISGSVYRQFEHPFVGGMPNPDPNAPWFGARHLQTETDLLTGGGHNLYGDSGAYLSRRSEGLRNTAAAIVEVANQ